MKAKKKRSLPERVQRQVTAVLEAAAEPKARARLAAGSDPGVSTFDRELEAMRTCHLTLLRLKPDEQRRIIGWLSARLIRDAGT